MESSRRDYGDIPTMISSYSAWRFQYIPCAYPVKRFVDRLQTTDALFRSGDCSGYERQNRGGVKADRQVNE